MAEPKLDVVRVDVAELTYEWFINEHWKPRIPLVITNATRGWNISNRLDPDFLRSSFDDRRTLVDGMEYSMNEILDLIEGKDTTRPVPYPCKFHLPTQLPELVPLVSPLDLGFAKPNWLQSSWFKRGYWGSALEMFIGGTGGKFPYVHLDYYHLSAWINQLYGRKEFTVWPNGQDRLLYPDPKDPWKSSIPDIDNVDHQKYPLNKEATPIKFVVGPGETLFLPFGIWHTAKSLEPTISIAFDLLNGHNFPEFLKDVWSFKSKNGMVKGAAATAYAGIGGLLCRAGDALGVQRESVHK